MSSDKLGEVMKVVPNKNNLNDEKYSGEKTQFHIGTSENDDMCDVVQNPSQVSPEEQSTVIHDEHHIPKLLKVGDGSIITTLSASDLASEVQKQAQTASNIPSHPDNESKVLVLYTGGTIGMKAHDGVYIPEANYLPKAIYQIPHLNDRNYVNTYYNSSTIRPFTLPPIRHMQKRIVYWVKLS